MGNAIPMTQIGKRKIEEELRQLKTVERPAVIRAIAEARAHGDLSENAEYSAAKERQSFIEGRIQELEDKLARAHVIDPSQIRSDRILFGATVELLDLNTDEQKRYRIVGTEEADAKLGYLSIESPIARQLLNKRVGDVVSVRIPKGELEVKVVDIRYE
jgi:transcription elongation factor GreA